MVEKEYKILTINPGSTSTKIAVYENEQELFRKTIDHDLEELSKYKVVADQLPLRKQAILDCLKVMNFSLAQLAAVSGRGGGGLPPVKKGAYRVNPVMVDQLVHRNYSDHASNLGALLAYDIGNGLHIPAYIYDAVAVDELMDVARLSGLPELPRVSRCHVLNMRAVALKVAEKMYKNVEELNIIVTHMGGGVTSSIINKGRLIDLIADDEGPYSPERAGRVQCRKLIDLCFSGKHNRWSATRRVKGEGGLVAYLGTNSALAVEEKIKNGDEYAKLVYYGMAYQVAKGIGELATVVNGKVDVIILTGAVAHSKMMTEWITERVSFIAPVEIMPGENEMEALALGVLRVLRGQETANEFVEN
ncbi:butyrate kinase [Sporomusa acidovorans]|uniref:Probable butyrate kinase n=2 Tax=Sporomusa TaxID=2375 RepID=A0ABZ3IX58_SPOA4|nr:butyrate kinase [Sporomusa acidovorans]OZC13049.1 butyrate kinase 2 [Sporomusa acidovorans DSM 3132]SDF51164.1 butyrate kinase [Sporomusa acidovorans]